MYNPIIRIYSNKARQAIECVWLDWCNLITYIGQIWSRQVLVHHLFTSTSCQHLDVSRIFYGIHVAHLFGFPYCVFFLFCLLKSPMPEREFLTFDMYDEFEDTKEVIRIHKSKTDGQHNVQRTKDKRKSTKIVCVFFLFCLS
jgi:hypothetical protein